MHYEVDAFIAGPKRMDIVTTYVEGLKEEAPQGNTLLPECVNLFLLSTCCWRSLTSFGDAGGGV